MKSLKRIYKYIILFNIILLLSWVSQIVFYALLNNTEFYKTYIEPESLGLTIFSLILLNFMTYTFIQLGVKKLIDNGLFSRKNAKQLKHAGFGIFGYWILNVVLSAYSNGLDSHFIAENKPLIFGHSLVGILLIVISAILEDGIEIKEDNDLTI